MIWSFLLLLLQITNFSSAAPVVADLGENYHFDALSTEANFLTTAWENSPNRTEIASDVKSLQVVTEKLRNSTYEALKDLEEWNELYSADINLQNRKDESVVLSSTTENPTKETMTEFSDTRNSLDFTTETLSFLTTSKIALELDPENISPENEEKYKDFTTTLTNYRNTETTETKLLPDENVNNFVATTTDQQDPTLIQAVDSFVEDILEIGDKLSFLPDKPESVKTQAVAETLEKENGTKLALQIDESIANDFTQAMNSISNQGRETIEQTTEFYNMRVEESSAFDNDREQASFEEPNVGFLNGSVSEANVHKISSKPSVDITAFTSENKDGQEEYSTKSAFKQSVSSYQNDSSSIKDSIEKVINETEQPALQNFETQSKINSNETQQIPSFKKAAVSFIEDIGEFENNLTMQSSSDKQVPTSVELGAEEINQETSTPLEYTDETTDTPTSQKTQDFENFPSTAISHVTFEENGRRTEIEIANTPSILEQLSETLNKSNENLVENETSTYFSGVMQSVPTLENGRETFARKMSSEEKSPTSLENKLSSPPTLAYPLESSTKAINRDELINDTLDVISNFVTSTEFMQENIQSSEEEMETSSKKYEVAGNSRTQLEAEPTENNPHIPMEKYQISTRRLEDESDFGPTQFRYLAELNKGNESIEKLNANNTHGSNEIIDIEISQPNDQIDETTEALNDVTENSGFTTESHKITQETSNSSFSHLAAFDNESKLRENESTETPLELFENVTEETTFDPVTQTTIKSHNFEEELTTAVKILEETTHHQLKEFQNNLKQAFQKFTSIETTTETEDQQIFLVNKTHDINTADLNSEELHRSGVIRQHFFDKFADNYSENFNAAEANLQPFNDSAPNNEILITTTPLDEKFETTEVEIKNKDNEELIAKQSDNAEAIMTTESGNGLGEGIATVHKSTTTEYISDTTTQPNLARVTLQNDFQSSFSFNSIIPADTEAAFNETTTQVPENNKIQQTNLEDFSTTLYKETEETTILPIIETSQKEMVTFIQTTESTTKNTTSFEEENQEPFTTTQIQETKTEYTLMKEQHMESTTEQATQTESTESNEQTAATTNREELDAEDTTVEAEIYTSTNVEDNETTLTPIQSGARSLSLTPPKLEYLQSDEGVEVFYGYSIVKHN